MGAEPEEEPADPLSFRQRLRNLRNCDHYKDIKVLRYWDTQSHRDLEMAAVAEVVLALPISQVSVERAFSHLPLILTDRRSRLGDKTLDNNLTVKLNLNKYM